MYCGDEKFVDGEHGLPVSLLDFWRWSCANLLDNTARGLLAEYLVAVAINAKESLRQEWAAWDLTAPSGVKVEVKSAVYLQNWTQRKLSVIQFGIATTRGWSSESGKYDEITKRQADYYVFCLLKHTDRATVNVMDLSQWEFYVLPAAVLNQHCERQKSIGLSKIRALGAEAYTWQKLGRLQIWR